MTNWEWAALIVGIVIIVYLIYVSYQPDPMDCGCGCGGTKARLQANAQSYGTPAASTAANTTNSFAPKKPTLPKKMSMTNPHRDMHHTSLPKLKFTGFPPRNEFLVPN
jgi:hypothetical protein